MKVSALAAGVTASTVVHLDGELFVRTREMGNNPDGSG
jgi:hypothetical protein